MVSPVTSYVLLILIPYYSLQFSLWLRDVLDDLCSRKLKDINDFEWQRFLRPYLKPLDHSLLSPDEASSPQPGPAEGEKEEENGNTVVLQCLDQQIEYGFEYLGCASIPVFTQRANNYIIAFTQVSDIPI